MMGVPIGTGSPMTEWDVAAVLRVLDCARLPLDDEKLLQTAMALRFTAAGIAHEREKSLGDGDIVDFLIGGVAVEVKIKGARAAIYRQCARYCAHDAVTAIILATNIAMALPERVGGKPAFVAMLGSGWL